MESVQRIRAEEVLLLPLVQAGQDLHQIGGRSRSRAAMTGGVILPVKNPTWGGPYIGAAAPLA